jgi:ABC-type uncharacterized transport system auxiliary subunit
MQRLHARLLAFAFALAAAALPVLAGCSLLERNYQPTASYLIAPPPQPPIEGERFGSMTVSRFGAIPPFDGRPFLYHATDGTWRADAYAGFIATPSDMVSEALSRALEQSGRAAIVGSDGVAMRFDFSIDGVVEAFYADFTDPAAPKAVVQLRGYLLDRRKGAPKLVAQLRGSGTAPIAAAEPGRVAEALSAATGVAIQRLLAELPRNVPEEAATALGEPKAAADGVQ